VRRWPRQGRWLCAFVLLAGTAAAATRHAEGPALPDSAMVAQAHFDLGLMYHERLFESLDNAIAEYEKAVRVKPDYAEAQYYLGLSYHTKAKLRSNDKALYRKAVAAYKRYLKYEPRGQLAAQARQHIRVVQARLR
jgi:tetratricopeptide (TPR) repeat protein